MFRTNGTCFKCQLPEVSVCVRALDCVDFRDGGWGGGGAPTMLTFSSDAAFLNASP